jgi:hypothetical protein
MPCVSLTAAWYVTPVESRFRALTALSQRIAIRAYYEKIALDEVEGPTWIQLILEDTLIRAQVISSVRQLHIDGHLDLSGLLLCQLSNLRRLLIPASNPLTPHLAGLQAWCPRLTSLEVVVEDVHLMLLPALSDLTSLETLSVTIISTSIDLDLDTTPLRGRSLAMPSLRRLRLRLHCGYHLEADNSFNFCSFLTASTLGNLSSLELSIHGDLDVSGADCLRRFFRPDRFEHVVVDLGYYTVEWLAKEILQSARWTAFAAYPPPPTVWDHARIPCVVTVPFNYVNPIRYYGCYCLPPNVFEWSPPPSRVPSPPCVQVDRTLSPLYSPTWGSTSTPDPSEPWGAGVWPAEPLEALVEPWKLWPLPASPVPSEGKPEADSAEPSERAGGETLAEPLLSCERHPDVLPSRDAKLFMDAFNDSPHLSGPAGVELVVADCCATSNVVFGPSANVPSLDWTSI